MNPTEQSGPTFFTLITEGDLAVATYHRPVLGDEDNIVTSFMRCDRGPDYTDHHTFLCIGLGEIGFDFAAAVLRPPAPASVRSARIPVSDSCTSRMGNPIRSAPS